MPDRNKASARGGSLSDALKEVSSIKSSLRRPEERYEITMEDIDEILESKSPKQESEFNH